MTVKELIEKLQELPLDYEIQLTTRNVLLEFYEIDIEFDQMRVLFKFNYA